MPLQKWTSCSVLSEYAAEGDMSEILDLAYDRHSQDIALVLLPANLAVIEGIGLPLVSEPLTAWEPLHIIGINRYLQRFQNAEIVNSLSFSTSITMDPRCSVRANSGGAVLHSCHTDGGLSGSPMVRIDDGRFWVAGIHTRGDPMSKSEKDPQCSQNSIGGVNRGIGIISPEQ
jgi:hypothetical protein